MRLAEALMHTFKRNIGTLALLPGGGGVFDVRIGGDLVFSKQRPGHFPPVEDMIAAVHARLG